MKSVAGRTALAVLVIMSVALGFVLFNLSRGFQVALQEQAQQEFELWWQKNNHDSLDLYDLLSLPGGSSDFRLLSIAQLQETGAKATFVVASDRSSLGPAVEIVHTDRFNNLLLKVWSPRLQRLHNLQQGAVLGLLALVGLAGLTTFFVVMKNMQSLRELTTQAHRLIQGSFERHFETTGPKEVEVLSAVFEQIRLRFRQVVSGAITQAMIWEGQLDLFPMSQLLLMLRFTSQTGVLVVMAGNNLGRICLRDGHVQGAFFKEQKGFRAFYALFLLPRGSFKFNPKMKSFRDELSVASWYSVLLYAARRVTSLHLIEQYIPDQRFVAKKTDLAEEMDLIQSDLTLPEWELYDSIDGQANVRELARLLHWTLERVQRYLYRFAVVGLIETELTLVTEPPPDNVVSLWSRAAWNKRSGGI